MVSVDESKIDDLYKRIDLTRWPDEVNDEIWTLGTKKSFTFGAKFVTLLLNVRLKCFIYKQFKITTRFAVKHVLDLYPTQIISKQHYFYKL